MNPLSLRLALATGILVAVGVPAVIAQSAEGPIRCEIALDPVAGGTLIEGRIDSDIRVRGTYAMAITSRTGGGSVSLRQSGDFEAAPGAPARLGETRLPGGPERHHVDLEIRVDGRNRSCQARDL